MDLEKRVEDLEKKVAELEGQIQAQPDIEEITKQIVNKIKLRLETLD